jgi:hypothetical protein
MMGDLRTLANPYPIMIAHMIDETGEAGDSSRPAYQSAMQRHCHHLGMIGAFGIEPIEGVAQIGKKLVCRL